MILGMEKRKISKILVTETSIVGIISLIAGLIIGMGVSQGLSVFTLKLFEVSINEYRFAVSTRAIGKTTLYFGIMFLLVMIFNIFVISKYKIIDLLTSGRKNENIKFKNPFIYLLSFLLCVVLLGFAYKSILKIGLNLREPMFKPSIAFVIVGTVLFFFSLAGVILYVVNKNKKIYFKRLNMFVVKQINSKVNTNFLSMSLICLMLFITILVLSTGISLKNGLEEGFKRQAPFDASIRIKNNGKKDNLEDVLDKINFKRSKNEKYATCNEYFPGIKLGRLLSITDKDYKDNEASFVKISDYNKMLKLRGKKEINLNKNEILVMSTNDAVMKQVNEKLKNGKKINIKGKEYLVKNNKIIDENLSTYLMADNIFTIIISDEFLYDYNGISFSILNVMYSDKNREENNKKYIEINKNYLDGKYKSLNISYMDAFSKDDIYSHIKGGTTSILFVGIYLGLVFLITSMAVLVFNSYQRLVTV